MSDANILMCGTTKGRPRPGRDAVVGKCVHCAADVWMAPSSAKLVREQKDVMILCDACCLKEVEKEGEKALIKVSLAPGAAEELLADAMNIENN